MASKKIHKTERTAEPHKKPQVEWSGQAFAEPDLPTAAPISEPEDLMPFSLETPGRRHAPEKLLAARQQAEDQFIVNAAEQALAAEAGTESHGFENIVGVGISEKIAGNQYTNEPSITVYVVAKVSKEAVAPEALVPPEINGVPTDVVETGEFRISPFRGRYRPAPGGVSVGHFRITAGTLGCLVHRGELLYILSNNHVLANVNSGHLGDPIVQPGPIDGGKVPADTIASLSQFVPIKFGGAINDVDCAIAQTSSKLVVPTNIAYGRIGSPPVPCRRDLLVKKTGRTTQSTRGRITDCNATVRVNYGPSGIAIFQNQIIIVSLLPSPFSAGGDSGSLIVTDQGNQPVGLLFAGTQSHTLANPIQPVLTKLNVAIVT
jgi:hypothetical protein